MQISYPYPRRFTVFNNISLLSVSNMSYISVIFRLLSLCPMKGRRIEFNFTGKYYCLNTGGHNTIEGVQKFKVNYKKVAELCCTAQEKCCVFFMHSKLFKRTLTLESKKLS